jgi:hypothetical protein
MYVDRKTCNACVTFLPYLLRYYGVKEQCHSDKGSPASPKREARTSKSVLRQSTLVLAWRCGLAGRAKPLSECHSGQRTVRVLAQ